MYGKRSNPLRTAKLGDPVEVDPTLAMTPSQMDEMRRRGVPISTTNLESSYYEGLPPDKLKFDLPIGETRGVDISEVWNAQKDARRAMTKVQQAATIDNPSTAV